jgi:hypothetical protein
MYNAELYTTDGTFLGTADVWWQRAGVVAEVDSGRYDLSPADYDRTVRRHHRMAARGINVLHFLPAAVTNEPTIVIRSLRAAIRAGRARPQLPIVAKPSTPASTPASAVGGGLP